MFLEVHHYLQLIDELATYDEPANGTFRHLWRISDTDYEYKFFHGSDYGIDANTSFIVSGLSCYLKF